MPVNIAFEILILALFVVLAGASYWFLSRVFVRLMDPTGEYGLGHGLPLPGIVRVLIFIIAILVPGVLVAFLASAMSLVLLGLGA